jgi:Reverse transcriptase (RNA-dependent DNA polymerase)
MSMVRILLSVATNLGWDLYQMDVKNTFFQGIMEEEVYMTLPPGHKNTSNPSLVCRLKKAIYGLKQSPRAWYANLSFSLLKNNFIKSTATYLVSDMYSIRVRVRFACDTHTILQLAYQSILTTLIFSDTFPYAPICPRYIHDIFSR